MPSASLERWTNERQVALDEIESAHQSIGGSGPGRRFATLQINYAYTMLLSAQFQAYCRDLHNECVVFLVQGVRPVVWSHILRSALVRNRKLDHGNPSPANIGSDFGHFGVVFWQDVRQLDLRNEGRQELLEELNEWRNAIAHLDFTKPTVSATLHLHRVRGWRAACNQLAPASDEVMRRYLQTIHGLSPW